MLTYWQLGYYAGWALYTGPAPFLHPEYQQGYLDGLYAADIVHKINHKTLRFSEQAWDYEIR
jgi:hypothetical protein